MRSLAEQDHVASAIAGPRQGVAFENDRAFENRIDRRRNELHFQIGSFNGLWRHVISPLAKREGSAPRSGELIAEAQIAAENK